VTPLATHVLAWRSGPRAWLTLTAKVTLAYAATGEMRVVAAAPICEHEVHHRGNASCSIRAASDVAPRRARCDVTLVGHAHARGGAPTERMTVRLSLLRGGAVLLDKSLVVLGDRLAGADAPAKPFTRIPVVYERARGGAGDRANPLGVAALENFTAGSAVAAPAGFAPISAAWPLRKRHARAPLRQLGERVPDLAAFDAEFFQTSPEDQRVDFLRGDEVLVLDGLDAAGTVRASLPNVRAAARAHVAGTTRPVALVVDGLVVDADARTCSLVLRGVVELPHERALADARFDVTLERDGKPMHAVIVRADRGLSAPRDGQPSEVRAMGDTVLLVEDEPSVDAARPSLTGTFDLSDEELAAVRARVAHPFQSAPVAPAPEPSRPRATPGAPWSDERPAPPPVGTLHDGTLELGDEPEPAAVARAEPVPAAPRVEAPSAHVTRAEPIPAAPIPVVDDTPASPPAVQTPSPRQSAVRPSPRADARIETGKARAALRDVYAKLKGSGK
jgi:hypothetical protein